MAATAKFQQFVMDTETVGAGWKMYHYEPGTTTLRDVWLDRGKVDTAAQPLVADENGLITGYFDGLYDLAIYDEDDVLLYTWEDAFFVDQQALGAEGSTLSSSSPVVLDANPSVVYYHVSGTASIDSLSGTQSFVILTFDSTPFLTHGSNFRLQYGRSREAIANETVLFVNDGGGVWREVGIFDRQETVAWTPEITFQTAGDLSVSYTTQDGLYMRDGRIGMISFSIVTSSFTFTTASGTLWITGMPGSILPDDNMARFNGTLNFRGITKANYTQFTPYVADGVTNIQITASGQGQVPADVAAADMPTGGTVVLTGTIWFMQEPV